MCWAAAGTACKPDLPPRPSGATEPVSATVDSTVWLDSLRRAEEEQIFRDAAHAAWQFANRNYQPATGLIKPFDSYAIGTIWDLASGLAALFCAHELGLLTAADYNTRMTRALATLDTLPLFQDLSFNKEYAFESGQLIGITRMPGPRGYGVSATDTGRLLIWLRIIANQHPHLAPAVQSVVERIATERLIDKGYLTGYQIVRARGRSRRFQEGRIGYEQYAAHGFAAWGDTAQYALTLARNAADVEVNQLVLPRDLRGNDRLTSEPFVLLGLEVGWTPEIAQVARRLLAAQQARHADTGILTMVSEDALNIAPHYFFYYTVFSRHGRWSIDVQRPGVVLEPPRWISTKAAFAWHALLPGDYTRQVVDSIRKRALVGGVWGSGVFEDGRATGNANINTAAVVLEAALYRQRGAPLIVKKP